MLPLYSVCVEQFPVPRLYFTCTDMEDAYTGISVQKVTVYIDLTFQHLHNNFRMHCH
jgi:hypothetical protein